MTYKIFSYTDDRGAAKYLAISTEALQEDSNPNDYIPGRSRDIQESGKVEIEGDTHLLDSYFLVNTPF